MFFICVVICSFSPQDIVYKNIDLVPDPIDHSDRYPDFKKYYEEEGSEVVMPPKKFTTSNSEKLPNYFTEIKDVLKEITSSMDIEKLKPTADGVDYMFNISDIKAGLEEKHIISKSSKPLFDGSGSFEINFLEKETTKIPILNNFPGMPNMYNTRTPVIADIGDVQVPGLDDVLPTSIGKSLNTNVNVDPIIFTDFITPDKILSTTIIDSIP